MKKINILRKNVDFDKIFKNNNHFSSKYVYLYEQENDVNCCRFGICVSKKIGNAVTRNKYKRQIKDIIDKSGLQFKDKDYIIILKKSALYKSYQDLKEDIVNILTLNR